MTIFVSGGCKNGKSTIAENLAVQLSCGKNLYYIATMIASDNEDKLRIMRHRQSRKGKGFETIECPQNLSKIIKHSNENATYLIDSATALLANKMFAQNVVNVDAHKEVADDLTEFLKWAKNVVIVSDYIYSDAIIYHDLTNAYRKNLAFVDCQCAKACDVVLEVSYNSVVVHKGNISSLNYGGIK